MQPGLHPMQTNRNIFHRCWNLSKSFFELDFLQINFNQTNVPFTSGDMIWRLGCLWSTNKNEAICVLLLFCLSLLFWKSVDEGRAKKRSVTGWGCMSLWEIVKLSVFPSGHTDDELVWFVCFIEAASLVDSWFQHTGWCQCAFPLMWCFCVDVLCLCCLQSLVIFVHVHVLVGGQWTCSEAVFPVSWVSQPKSFVVNDFLCWSWLPQKLDKHPINTHRLNNMDVHTYASTNH